MTDPFPFEISREILRRRVGVNGEAGRAWFDRLPDVVRACAARWELTLLRPFPNLSYNYVSPVVRPDGAPAVLKILFPDREFLTESAALELFPAESAVRLLAKDESLGAMLLERVVPGVSLRGLPDEDAVAATASVIRKLHRPLPSEHPFPSVADWGKAFARARDRFRGASGPLREALFAEAAETFASLVASSGPAVLLHGDLHHDNILTATREPFLAFDPKGVAGEREYEVGSYLRNWLPDLLQLPDPAATAQRRIAQFADELGFDRQRLRGWGMAQAVLSTLWAIEDGEDRWEWGMACAELMSARRT